MTSSDHVPGLVRLSIAPRLVFGFGAAMLALFVACLVTATSPVLNWQTHAQNGDSALIDDFNDFQAERLYLAGVDSDPLSPEPWERLSGLYMRQWRQTTRGGEDAFRKVLNSSQRAYEQNPHNSNSYRRLGQWLLEKYDRTLNPLDAQTAADILWEAVIRYPHEATTRAELAAALGKSGQAAEARKQVELAYALDEINRREGHRDKYLRAAIADALRQIVDQPRSAPQAPNGAAGQN